MALLTTATGDLRVELAKGFPPEVEGLTVRVPDLPRAPVRIPPKDGGGDSWQEFFRGHGVSMLIALFDDERLIGALGFSSRLSRKKMAARETTYLRSLANLAATAIARAESYHELQQVNRRLDRKIQEMNTLFELGKEFSSLLDPDRLLRLVVLSVMGQIGASRYMICLRRGADMQVVASRVDGAPPQPELLAALAREKTPVVVSDMIFRGGTDPRPPLAGLGLVVLVPMQLQGEVKGILLLGEKLSREPYSREDLEFLVSMGNLAITALENARLFAEAIDKQRMEDELLLAREIQKGLLPSVLPELPGLAIAASNVSSKQVGGDYYDVIPLGNDRAVIAIGDVSGKGSPAALLMANLQATIRALVPIGLPLGELTGRVNDLMCQNTGGNKFITFFWGILDAATLTLTYVNAGHNYPFVVRAGGGIDRLESGGMILGVIPSSAPYGEDTVSLSRGDTLVMFTDGVSEAMNLRGEEYGEARLENLLRLRAGTPASELLDRIRQDVLLHADGAPQSDDLTMMVVSVMPPSA
jgi:sigma-B regulation protein RsbU (phosphoserine phosphatase)